MVQPQQELNDHMNHVNIAATGDPLPAHERLELEEDDYHGYVDDICMRARLTKDVSSKHCSEGGTHPPSCSEAQDRV